MTDYQLETRLKENSPELHGRLNDIITVAHEMLQKYRAWFPNYTDHSDLHSMDVLDYCNRLIGDNIDKLSAEECYVIIMSCYLHDIGMGVTEKDYLSFSKLSPISGYLKEHPDESTPGIIRTFHHELSGMMIDKYSGLFEIDSKELLFAVKQVCRGHRKTDLFDDKEYPVLSVHGRTVNTAYLAAIIRLADEIDVGSLRNPGLLFDSSSVTDQADIDAFGTHDSIKDVIVQPDRIILKTEPVEPRYDGLIEELRGKLQETLDYCRKAVRERTDLEITQTSVVVESFPEYKISC